MYLFVLVGGAPRGAEWKTLYKLPILFCVPSTWNRVNRCTRRVVEWAPCLRCKVRTLRLNVRKVLLVVRIPLPSPCLNCPNLVPRNRSLCDTVLVLLGEMFLPWCRLWRAPVLPSPRPLEVNAARVLLLVPPYLLCVEWHVLPALTVVTWRPTLETLVLLTWKNLLGRRRLHIGGMKNVRRPSLVRPFEKVVRQFSPFLALPTISILNTPFR